MGIEAQTHTQNRPIPISQLLKDGHNRFTQIVDGVAMCAESRSVLALHGKNC